MNVTNVLNDPIESKYLFFWKSQKEPYTVVNKGCLCQWQSSVFLCNEIVYNCAEQFMMAKKAVLFRDEETFDKIMSTKKPSEHLRLGRTIKDFDQSKWDEIKEGVVFYGNLLKFTQNIKMLKFLLSTEKQVLVEASPSDKIWGIGMDEKHPDILDESKWKGQNLLGKALMKVRDVLTK